MTTGRSPFSVVGVLGCLAVLALAGCGDTSLEPELPPPAGIAAPELQIAAEDALLRLLPALEDGQLREALIPSFRALALGAPMGRSGTGTERFEARRRLTDRLADGSADAADLAALQLVLDLAQASR